MLLTGSADEPISIVLDDDSEIEITVIELEGNKSKVIVCSEEHVSVIHKLMSNSIQHKKSTSAKI